jgi:hypothetical protein
LEPPSRILQTPPGICWRLTTGKACLNHGKTIQND